MWWDTRLKAGEIWDEVIEKEIKTARTVVLLWSHASVNSRWVKREARIADKRRILAPVRLQEVDIPLEFSDVQAADLIDWQGDRAHDGLRQLINDIIAIASAPARKDGEVAPALFGAPSDKRSRARFGRFGRKRWLLASMIVAALAAVGAGYVVYQRQDHRPSAEWQQPPFRNLVGRYRADGKNPDGTSYTGEVEIRNENAMYYFIWTINSQTLYGSGTLNNNILNINWSGGLVSYVLQPNGVLQGSWANGQGTETLTPYGSPKRDEGPVSVHLSI